ASYVTSPNMVVLDYGCGEALHAEIVAEPAAKLILAEPAPGVRERLTQKFRDNPKIMVTSTEDLGILPDHSADLIVMHSVSQYLTSEELIESLRRIRRLIKPDGRFVLGDVLQPNVTAFGDAWALLRFGMKEGFFIPAFVSLVRTFFSDYWSLRSKVGLARYDE